MRNKMSIREAEDLAQSYRTKWELSKSAPIHVKTILRKLNVLAVYRPLSTKFYGLSAKSSSGTCFVLVNSNKTRADQHFTIAHELYHLFENQGVMCTHMEMENENSKDIEEKNADLFASAFLMPQCAIEQMIPNDETNDRHISVATLFKIEQYFSVSREAVLRRLDSLKLINHACLAELRNTSSLTQASSYGYDTSLYLPGNENIVLGDFGERIYKLFESGKISEGHYYELLNLINYGKNSNCS